MLSGWNLRTPESSVSYHRQSAPQPSGSYNPLKAVKKNSKDDNDYENTVQQILVMMMAEATAAFEKLPLLWDSEILRNILYSGVWAKYNKKQKEKQEKQERDGK